MIQKANNISLALNKILPGRQLYLALQDDAVHQMNSNK